MSEEVGFSDLGSLVRLYPLSNEINIAKTASFHRRTRHNLQRQQVIYSIVKQQGLAGNGSLILEKLSGRNSKFIDIPLAKQDEQFSFEYLRSNVDKEMVNEVLSTNLCESCSNDLKISINEIIDYFLVIKLFAIDKFKKLPENSAISKPGALYNFSVEVDCQKFCRALATHFSDEIEKANKIFDFLKFSSNNKKDLWANPLIQRNERKSMLLLAPFMEASLLRNSELWATQLGLDSSEKGFGYEIYVRDRVSESLQNNDIFSKSEVCYQSKFKFSGEEEEIDLVLRIGDLIVLGEIKNIITVDGPSSFRNSRDRVFEALSQIKRKELFVNKNIGDFLNKTGWSDLEGLPVKVQPIVLVSNYTFAGFKLNDIPILDELLLSIYCRHPIIPMFSETGQHGTTHRIGTRLYRTEKEAEQNFSKYANNPPQLQTIKNGIHCVEYEALVPHDIGKRLRFGKLEVSENQDAISVLALDTGFEIVENPTIEGF